MIEDVNPSVRYEGDGNSNTIWAVTFPFLLKNDVKVYTIFNGESTLLAEGTDYNITVNDPPLTSGNTVYADVNVIAGVPVETDLLMQRESAFTQPTDFPVQAKTVERSDDRIVSLCQELKRDISNGVIKFPVSDSILINNILPAASERFNSICTFDAEGGVDATSYDDFIQIISEIIEEEGVLPETTPNHIIAGPASGVTPDKARGRAMVVDDLPQIPGSKLQDINASTITTGELAGARMQLAQENIQGAAPAVTTNADNDQVLTVEAGSTTPQWLPASGGGGGLAAFTLYNAAREIIYAGDSFIAANSAAVGTLDDYNVLVIATPKVNNLVVSSYISEIHCVGPVKFYTDNANSAFRWGELDRGSLAVNLIGAPTIVAAKPNSQSGDRLADIVFHLIKRSNEIGYYEVNTLLLPDGNDIGVVGTYGKGYYFLLTNDTVHKNNLHKTTLKFNKETDITASSARHVLYGLVRNFSTGTGSSARHRLIGLQTADSQSVGNVADCNIIESYTTIHVSKCNFNMYNRGLAEGTNMVVTDSIISASKIPSGGNQSWKFYNSYLYTQTYGGNLGTTISAQNSYIGASYDYFSFYGIRASGCILRLNDTGSIDIGRGIIRDCLLDCKDTSTVVTGLQSGSYVAGSIQVYRGQLDFDKLDVQQGTQVFANATQVTGTVPANVFLEDAASSTAISNINKLYPIRSVDDVNL